MKLERHSIAPNNAADVSDTSRPLQVEGPRRVATQLPCASARERTRSMGGSDNIGHLRVE